jgi:ADP-ribose pyrophosphatase YjhB (NUDIX family)
MHNNHQMNDRYFKSIKRLETTYCHNCGRDGHIRKKCKFPVLSFGIILFYPYNPVDFIRSDPFQSRVRQHITCNNTKEPICDASKKKHQWLIDLNDYSTNVTENESESVKHSKIMKSLQIVNQPTIPGTHTVPTTVTPVPKIFTGNSRNEVPKIVESAIAPKSRPPPGFHTDKPVVAETTTVTAVTAVTAATPVGTTETTTPATTAAATPVATTGAAATPVATTGTAVTPVVVTPVVVTPVVTTKTAATPATGTTVPRFTITPNHFTPRPGELDKLKYNIGNNSNDRTHSINILEPPTIGATGLANHTHWNNISDNLNDLSDDILIDDLECDASSDDLYDESLILAAIPPTLTAQLEAIIKKEASELKYLMILDRHTPDYAQIIWGNYDFNNSTYIRTLISRLSNHEIRLIETYSLNHLFVKYWIFSKRDPFKVYRKQYIQSKIKFDLLKSGTYTVAGEYIKFSDMVASNERHWPDPDWGFPKGRRKRYVYESDLDCAMREFREETGISPKNYQIIKEVKPIEEIFYGSDGVQYKNVYYLARANSYLPLYFNPYNSQQVSEIRKIGWYNRDQAMSQIRGYHKERKNLLNKVSHYLESKLLF